MPEWSDAKWDLWANTQRSQNTRNARYRADLGYYAKTFLSIDEIRQFFGLIPDFCMDEIVPGNRVPGTKQVIFVYHSIALDGDAFQQIFGGTPDNTKWYFPEHLPNVQMIGSFDTYLASLDLLDEGAGHMKFDQVLDFRHPGIEVRAKKFVGEHNALNDTMVTLMNALAMIMDPERGLSLGGENRKNGWRTRKHRLWFDQDLEQPLGGIKDDIELWCFDVEAANYKSLEAFRSVYNNSKQRIPSGWPIKEYGISIVRLNDLKKVAPGYNARNWHQFIKPIKHISLSTLPTPGSLPDQITTCSHIPNPRPVPCFRNFQTTYIPFGKAVREELVRTINYLAAAKSGVLDSDVQPAMRLEHAKSTASYVPALPTYTPEGRASGVRYSCKDCAGMDFASEEDHEAYINDLKNTCPDNLSYHQKCRTYTDCISKHYICVQFNYSKNVCQESYKHEQLVHLKKNCGKGPKDTCEKWFNYKHNPPCRQWVEVYHIKFTCYGMFDLKRPCVGETCHLGHDHADIRKEIEYRRCELADANRASKS